MDTILLSAAICVGVAWGVIVLGVIICCMRSAQISKRERERTEYFRRFAENMHPIEERGE